MAKKKLLGHSATVQITEALTAAKGSSWVPEDEGASADEYIFDGRDWKTIRVFVSFRDAGGEYAAGTSAVFVPLFRVADPSTSTGYRWIAADVGITVNEGEFDTVAVDGHVMALRVTALTAGSANNGALFATGGERLEQSNG